MIRRLVLVFLLFIGFQTIASAQVRDSVRISIPPYTDTTCVGTQLIFSAKTSSDTFSNVTYHWYVNNVFTGVALDTFLTTALNDNDSVYCWLGFTNSFGIIDSSRSNSITIHHAASIPPRVLTSLVVGSNPDCSGNALTFEAYPISGGIFPQYQWFINGVEQPGEDSTRFTRVFGGADTVVCRLVSDAPCRAYDTAYSIPVPIIHIHLTASVFITTVYDSICQGGIDTFHAYASGYGNNATYQWYINGMPVLGANGFDFYTGALNDSDSVYVMLHTTDTCVLNPTTVSNSLYIIVRHVFSNHASIDLTEGANPGCLDSFSTFTARYDTFGVAPNLDWYINGTLQPEIGDTIRRQFARNAIVTFSIRTTDGGCYEHDTIDVPGVVMIRDTALAVAPVIHLIGDQLLTYSAGTVTWYHSAADSIGGIATIIPGATDTFYHPTMLGYYYLVVNNGNCPSQESNIIYISLLDVEHISKAAVHVYPNPTTGIVSMDWNTPVSGTTVTVYNALGQNVISQIVSNKSHTDVDLSTLPNGNYYLQVRDETGQYNSYKLVLQHN